MKANELMIDDWVKLKDAKLGNINFVGPYVQIKSITGRHVLVPNAKGLLEDVTEEYLMPIPLTPEILEKNGWIKTKYDYGRDCMEIHGADELPEGVDNALSMARWSIDKKYQYHFLDLYMWKGSVMQHNVHYVHQLQHAFRIFGIEKIIL